MLDDDIKTEIFINGDSRPASDGGLCDIFNFKSSGIGCNLGYDGDLAFAEPHSITGPAGFLL